tara:strand:- start:820 stop:2040 length:1221 start_codon:yes stop_codon:yes gene_type:complete
MFATGLTPSNMKPINLFSPHFAIEEILEEIRKCLEMGWTGMGFKTIEFEKAWSDYTKLPYCNFVASNTVGLHLALNIFKKAHGWEKGDEIITTPLTFVSTNHAIMYENLKPVFADIDSYLSLDPESVEENITSKTRAVIFVGMGGNPGQLDKIREICLKHNLKLILDAAHMAGTYVKVKNNDSDNPSISHVGFEADATVFSFQAVKNLPTADSGMVCFRNKKDYELAKQLSWLGIDKDTYSRTAPDGTYRWRYDVPNIGFKYHGNSIMAAIGLVQLKYLDSDNSTRNDLARCYDTFLSDLSEVEIVRESDYCHISSKHLYQIKVLGECKNGYSFRNKLIETMYKNKVYPGVHYVDNTTYPMYSSSEGKCRKAREYSDQLISLPLHLGLSEKDISRVSDIVRGVESY